METYDAIIIGAGPAGLMAARELDADKVNYLVIEAKSKIGSPIKCGEITRQDTFLELFERTDYSFIKNKISNISFRVKDTEKVIEKNMIMLDKHQFLCWLAEPVENNLMLNAKVVQIEKKENFLEIVTGNGTFYTKLAVLANSTNYKFQKDYNLVKKNVELVPCIGGFFINTTLHQNTAYFCYDEETYIALWIFPKENNLFNAGAGIILKNKKTEGLNLVKAFKQTLKKFEIPIEGEPSFGGHYVANGPIGRTYSDRLLVCGDSAGQVFAGIGEGIYFALKAGQLAGKMAIKAIKENRFHSEYLKNYEVDWKKSFGQQMDAGVIFTTVLFFLMRYHLAYKTLKIVKPKELLDIWFNGNVSFRIKVLYFCLKSIGYSPKR